LRSILFKNGACDSDLFPQWLNEGQWQDCAHKHRQLALCRQALEVPAPDAAVVETVDAFLRRVTGVALACCPHCGQAAMRLMEVIAPRRQHPCATGPP
jgi:hypothetical protein